MKILLINPSLREADVGHYSKSIEKQRGIYPPLGLAYIASSLEQHAHKVKIIDCDTDIILLKNIGEIYRDYDPDLTGIYHMTWTFGQAKGIAQEIRAINSEAKIVVGGPNVSSFPKLTLKYGGFDYAVKGEGEITINELVDAIERGDNGLEKIHGLVFKQNNGNRIVKNPDRPLIPDIDTNPFPAWHLLPLNKYFDVFTREKKFATMITSRGCPFNCTFCDKKNRMGRKWRARTPENVLDEIEMLNTKYKIREFMFFDDTFTVNRKRVLELCKGIKERKLDIIWECRARVDQIDRELLAKMRDGGCYRIRYGMESGDDEILKVMKKGIAVSQIRDCAKITKEEGIENFAYFMMGSPQETPETLEKTLNLALEIDPDFVSFSKTILIPGCDMLDWAANNGYIAPNHWELFLAEEETNSAPALATAVLPEEFVDNYISYANKKFYLRPKYVFRRLRNIKSPSQLYKHFLIAMGLLFSKKS